MPERRKEEEEGGLQPEISSFNKIIESGAAKDFFARNRGAIFGALAILQDPDEVRGMNW